MQYTITARINSVKGIHITLWTGPNESLDDYMTRVYDEVYAVQHTCPRGTLIRLYEHDATDDSIHELDRFDGLL